MVAWCGWILLGGRPGATGVAAPFTTPNTGTALPERCWTRQLHALHTYSAYRTTATFSFTPRYHTAPPRSVGTRLRRLDPPTTPCGVSGPAPRTTRIYGRTGFIVSPDLPLPLLFRFLPAGVVYSTLRYRFFSPHALRTAAAYSRGRHLADYALPPTTFGCYPGWLPLTPSLPISPRHHLPPHTFLWRGVVRVVGGEQWTARS